MASGWSLERDPRPSEETSLWSRTSSWECAVCHEMLHVSTPCACWRGLKLNLKDPNPCEWTAVRMQPTHYSVLIFASFLFRTKLLGHLRGTWRLLVTFDAAVHPTMGQGPCPGTAEMLQEGDEGKAASDTQREWPHQGGWMPWMLAPYDRKQSTVVAQNAP